MKKTPVIAIFDVGKTNKKLLLFNNVYEVVYEESVNLEEINDEDGFSCEDVEALTNWVKETYDKIREDNRFDIRAVNFSAYGASFVYLDEEGRVIPPLYNYLKPFPRDLQEKFYLTYGGESQIAKQTASPVLGNLNSGMQLYRLKYQQPEKFAAIKTALHLPQYLSYVLSGEINTDITSVGCHTNLWNFQKNNYHQWVEAEGLAGKFAPLADCTIIAGRTKEGIPAGVGLHDSSAALIPYLSSFTEPFILLSTGTWCISLNPFNHSRLSDYELSHDCLCYLSYEGKPVKASRLFAGYEHEQQVKRLSDHFQKPSGYYKTVEVDLGIIRKLLSANQAGGSGKAEGAMVGQSKFATRKLSDSASYEEAYHLLIGDIIAQQIRSTNLVLKGTPVKRIFVDGGFSKNPIYMHLMAEAYPGIEVYAASVAQATALGAALAFHDHWNREPLPSDIISLRLFTPVPGITY